MFNIQQQSLHSQYGQQYAITLEFQLQREKEKNKILEERLRNKQIFIVEMKKMHSQLELLSQKCRAELLQQRAKREQIERTTLRQYAETICQLEHKITFLQGLEASKGLSKYDQQLYLQRNKSAPKHQKFSQRKLQQSQSIRNINKKSYHNDNQNIEKQNEHLDMFKNFASRFLQMVSIYNQVNSEAGLKKNLKSAWKWIKQVVKQWQQNENFLSQIKKYCEKCAQKQIQCDSSYILKLIKSCEQEKEHFGDL